MFGDAHMSPNIERKGWDPMCNYSYLSGACANRRVDSLLCVGEDECEFSGMNIMGSSIGVSGSEDHDADKWLRLYCETHATFLCRKGDDDCRDGPRRAPKPAAPLQRRLDDEGGSW
jgi:hypothetical protein